MAIAAIRNAMVYKDRLTLNWTIFFVVLSVILGFLVNTMGIIGFLPIIAIVQITVCNYYLKTIKSIKISFIVNLLFYIVYFIAIYDFTSAVIQIITATIGFGSLLKLIKKEKED